MIPFKSDHALVFFTQTRMWYIRNAISRISTISTHLILGILAIYVAIKSFN